VQPLDSFLSCTKYRRYWKFRKKWSENPQRKPTIPHLVLGRPDGRKDEWRAKKQTAAELLLSRQEEFNSRQADQGRGFQIKAWFS